MGDEHARYFGTELTDTSITAGADARLGATTFAEWLAHESQMTRGRQPGRARRNHHERALGVSTAPASSPNALEPPNVGNWATPPRIGSELPRQVRDCVADLPWYVITPLLRHWHRTWGATATEVAATMPGDDLLPQAQYRCTRAIDIDAPPRDVWPWLVQVGYRRAGWYAGDLLDNFARPSVRRIVPELQDQRVGQWLSMVPKPSERTAFVVDSFEEPYWLLWRTPNRIVGLAPGPARPVDGPG